MWRTLRTVRTLRRHAPWSWWIHHIGKRRKRTRCYEAFHRCLDWFWCGLCVAECARYSFERLEACRLQRRQHFSGEGMSENLVDLFSLRPAWWLRELAVQLSSELVWCRSRDIEFSLRMMLQTGCEKPRRVRYDTSHGARLSTRTMIYENGDQTATMCCASVHLCV